MVQRVGINVWIFKSLGTKLYNLKVYQLICDILKMYGLNLIFLGPMCKFNQILKINDIVYLNYLYKKQRRRRNKCL